MTVLWRCHGFWLNFSRRQHFALVCNAAGLVGGGSGLGVCSVFFLPGGFYHTWADDQVVMCVDFIDIPARLIAGHSWVAKASKESYGGVDMWVGVFDDHP